MSTRRMKFWGWGLEDEGLSETGREALAASFAERFAVDGFTTIADMLAVLDGAS